MSDFDFEPDDVQPPPVQQAPEHEQASAYRPTPDSERQAPRKPRTMLLFLCMSFVGLLMLSGQGFGLHSLVKFQEATLQLAAERDIWKAEQKQREDTVAEWKKLVAGVKTDLQELRTRKDMLAEEVKPLEDQHSKLTAKADAARKRLDLLEKTVEEAVAAQKNAERKTQDASERHQELTDEIATMDSRRSPLKTEIDDLTTQRDAVAESLKDTDGTLKKYVEQLADLRADCKKIEDEILERRKERTEADKSYRAAADSLKTLSVEVETTKADRDALADECRQMNVLKAQKAQLEADLAAAQANAEAATKEQKTLQGELDRLNREKDQVEGLVAKGKAATARLVAEYEALKQRKKGLQEDITGLEANKGTYEGAIQLLEKKKAPLERECGELRARKELLDRDIIERQKTLQAIIEAAATKASTPPFDAGTDESDAATPSEESE